MFVDGGILEASGSHFTFLSTVIESSKVSTTMYTMVTREVPWNSPLRDLEEGIPKLKNIFLTKTHMCQFASLPASESGEAKELEYEMSYKI